MLAPFEDHLIGLPIGPRMAGVLTDPWRWRILMELAGGPLSPSQFVDRAGGSLDHISRCFRQLADRGFIEVIDERPGRRRGAAVEHLYQALERAYFDTATWEGMPRFHRDVISDSIVASFFNRAADAIHSGTFDQEIDRHLSWDGVVLDRQAWRELGSELDSVLHWLPDLEEESHRHITSADEELIPATIGLAAFRSPQSPDVMWAAPRPAYGDCEAARGPNDELITVEMAKVMRNRWRSRILMELSARPLSPSQFVEEIGGSPSHISRCFRELANWGYIMVVAERPGGRYGGGVEQIYRNTQRAYLDDEAWKKLPLPLRSEFSNTILNSFLTRINEAIQAGTFDAETDRHLSWVPVHLSRGAWHEVSLRLGDILESLPDLQSVSLARHKGPVEDLIPTTVGLSCFRSPSWASCNPDRAEGSPLEKACSGRGLSAR
jgi:DNA-binding HxlR family transcriptional regulator